MTEARRGRPRSREAHNAILAATRALLVECGYADVSMDRVAEQAGVGKQTVYRRWPSKAPLVAEAIMDAYGAPDAVVSIPDTGDIAEDLRTLMRQAAAFAASPDNAILLRALAAAAADDPHDGDSLYRQLTGPQRDGVVARLRQGVDAGQVRADVDLGAVADALVGAPLYRVLTRATATGEAMSHFDGLIDVLTNGFRPKPGVSTLA
ncbi:TetR/AcrR family transcriptional regulator [Aldersonia kunmingensis]|uniref:TetR/AcrR family transcriptional regulator n=1 Tax=Aldersonia kunmingensis TaxID=408066 RepID=UPI00082BAA04|nr:TetR/AcrR family transcriptional regulator [Aldersonia kunmingensis]